VDEEHVAGLLAQGIDWRRLVDQALEHGVVPFVYYTLKSTFAGAVPEAVQAQLRALYLHQYRRSIQIRGELPRLLDHLEAHGIDALAFKGPALAALAYSESHLRTFTDLDLLVHLGDVEATVDALKQAGFREKNPIPESYDTTWDSYRPWHPLHGNANGYVRDEDTPGALHVDVHWGLASRYFRFPLEPGPLWARSRPVELEGGATVRTFSPADTLLIQCMHAAKDAYYRLSHIADIAELLRTHPDLDLVTVLRRARDVSAERMVRLGLLLSRDLAGAPLPEDAPDRSASVRPLARRVAAALFERRHGAGLLLHRFRFHLAVRDRWTDGLGAAYQAVLTSLRPTDEDREWMDLPPVLELFYPLVRLGRYLFGPDEKSESSFDPAAPEPSERGAQDGAGRRATN
jgi:DNA-binding transcriptional MerR regulator